MPTLSSASLSRQSNIRTTAAKNKKDGKVDEKTKRAEKVNRYTVILLLFGVFLIGVSNIQHGENEKYLFVILFISAFCGDYRKPTRTQRKCFVKNIGEEPTKKLLDSLRKFHRSYGKATLLDYILEKRQDLKNIADECLLNNRRRRRLDKLDNNQLNSLESMVKYYLNAILKEQKAKKEFSDSLKKNKQMAKEICEKYLYNKQL